MTIADQLPQGLDRTGYLITDSGVLMLHYGAIKVYCYYHRAKLSLFSSLSFPVVVRLVKGEGEGDFPQPHHRWGKMVTFVTKKPIRHTSLKALRRCRLACIREHRAPRSPSCP